MHIVKTTDSTIELLPRQKYEVVSVSIIDEETRDEIYEDIAPRTIKSTDNTISIRPSFQFVEGRFYTFRVYKQGTSTEVYRGKIYCTDQTDLDKFTINKNTYTFAAKGDDKYIYR